MNFKLIALVAFVCLAQASASKIVRRDAPEGENKNLFEQAKEGFNKFVQDPALLDAKNKLDEFLGVQKNADGTTNFQSTFDNVVNAVKNIPENAEVQKAVEGLKNAFSFKKEEEKQA